MTDDPAPSTAPPDGSATEPHSTTGTRVSLEPPGAASASSAGPPRAVDSLGTIQMPTSGALAPPPLHGAPLAPPPLHDAARALHDAGEPPPVMPTVTGPVPGSSIPPVMPTVTGPVPGSSIPPVMPTMVSTELPLAMRVPGPPSLPPARYVLGGEIARGGMGRVVDATDTRLGRLVAFKEALSTDGDALRRFERETRITARLEHPSIVPVHDAGQSTSGAPFYVMRKVSGQPLERLVASAETLHQRLALIPHIVDAAQAIAHAHERGIVHRDIKPSNILVGDLGETVVIDWGLAKVIGEPDEPGAQSARPLVDLSDALKTRAGIVYGTPGFMAPEQLRGAPVNEQCDVYALGATLYHLLSRKPPHHARTADEMMKAAVAGPPTPILELVPGVPRDLATIVDKALAHDPRVRYRDARALALDLQRFLTGQLVASHHYSPRDKLVRFVRQNRGLSAAVAALLLVGTFAVVRIVIERNRADRAAIAAETERAKAVRRAEELTLAQARFNVELNPTKAIAMLKPLAATHWREVRAIAAAARGAGVAWSMPTSKQTLSLTTSHDGLRALSAGSDGVVRIHDLARRTTRVVAPLGAPVRARFADGERQLVAWHDTRLVILDAATGAHRELTTTTPIHDLEVVDRTAYWVDRKNALWQLEITSSLPSQIALPEPVRALAPSPDGRWIALAGESHLLLYDRTQPALPPQEIMLGETHEVAWAADSQNLAALIDSVIIDVELDPAPLIVHRQTVGRRQFVAHSAGKLYTIGQTGVAIISRTERAGDANRKPVSGTAVGFALARGGTTIAGGTGGLTVMSEDGDRVLPLSAARVEQVAASPRSPYVIAQLEHRLLVWNLDDIQPRRLSDQPLGQALFASESQVIAGGTSELVAQAIDADTASARPLGPWQGLRAVTAARKGQLVALVDGDRHLHLVGTGRTPEDLPGEIDLAGFATDDLLVIATLDGAISLYDVEHRRRTPLITGRTKLLGLAWGRGKHPWVAASFADGTLWRKNLVTGATASAARVPPLDPTHLADGDAKLLVAGDGSVVFLRDRALHTWRPDGAFERLAQLPEPLVDLGEAGADAIVAFAADSTLYTVARGARDRFVEALPSIDGTSAAMSPETGLLVALEHGAIHVLDPLVHQRWTLAQPAGVTFDNLAISPDGRRVLAGTESSLLVWSIDLPGTADTTAQWLDAMTNAEDDRAPGGLGWH